MITTKDIAPLDDASFELWRKELKHRKTKTLVDLYFSVKISSVGPVTKIMLDLLAMIVKLKNIVYVVK